MPILRPIMGRFEKQCETSDQHLDPTLQTRYYKKNSSELFLLLEQLLRRKQNLRIISSSREHGEIAAELNGAKKCFAVITVTGLMPLETAVDITISTEQSSPLGIYPTLKKELLSLYDAINNEFEFIGAGRYGNK
ncbi:hypothetical protein [Bacillus mesophilum]|uniref:Cytosolic protein n=1 Tax=Bacillus mesophilum TaxID=1071718 RepID=A0A7V7RNS5_9BACI|nr:hypothetical protein [Bacillus mesophilum]KAB2334188.1 hypothetical protein F7732_08940 [Bacillus mesophilum]